MGLRAFCDIRRSARLLRMRLTSGDICTSLCVESSAFKDRLGPERRKLSNVQIFSSECSPMRRVPRKTMFCVWSGEWTEGSGHFKWAQMSRFIQNYLYVKSTLLHPNTRPGKELHPENPHVSLPMLPLGFWELHVWTALMDTITWAG